MSISIVTKVLFFKGENSQAETQAKAMRLHVPYQ